MVLQKGSRNFGMQKLEILTNLFCCIVGILNHLPHASAGQLKISLVFSHDTLINIVASVNLPHSSAKMFSPETNLQLRGDPLSTYIYWTTSGLNLSIPKYGLEDNITLNMYYFKIQQRLSTGKAVFVLLTKGSFTETVKAIEKSGFGTSVTIPFFVLVDSLQDEVLVRVTQLLEDQLIFSQPFHASIVFFSMDWSFQIAYCYYCPGRLAKLLPIYTLSVDISVKISILLNNNGHKNTVSVRSVLYTSFVMEHTELVSCWSIFPSYKSGREKFLRGVRNCLVFDELFLSPLQHLLNVTFVTNFFENLISLGSQIGHVETGWLLEIRMEELFSATIPNRVAIDRGVVYTSMVTSNFMDKVGICNDFFDPDSTELNFSFFVVVDNWVWALFLVVILCYTLIWKNMQKVFILFLIFGRSISVPKHFRKYIWMYMCCATFFGWVYDSHVSSETLRLDDVNDPVYYIKNGYKVYMTPSTKFGMYWAGVHKELIFAKEAYTKLEKLLNVDNVCDIMDTTGFFHSSFLKMIEYMSASKVGVIPIHLKAFGIVNFFRQHGRLLVERRYSCQALDLSHFNLPPVCPSLRSWGLLSLRLKWMHGLQVVGHNGL